MLAFHNFLLLHAVAHLVQNGLGNEIIDGDLVPKDEMKYIVSLQTYNHVHECGGFLIRDDFVLTAAHCANIHEVIVGTHNLEKTNRMVKTISTTYKGNGYFDPGHGNDIQLVKLSSKVELGENIEHAPLVQPGMTINDGQECQVAGWGRKSTQGPMVHQLRRVDVTVINREVCKEKWPHLSEDAICAGGYETTHGFCKADSGGPLVCNGRVVGIVSYNFNRTCDYPDYPNVYVNIAKHLDWINTILNSNTY